MSLNLVNPTSADLLAMEMRLAQNRNRGSIPSPQLADPVPLEVPLHDDIMRWADNQKPWPWPYIHARTDKRSTIGKGVNDLTIFGPFPLCILVEAKARNEKQDKEQLIWAAKLKRQGWVVHVVRNMEDVFRTKVDAEQQISALSKPADS